LISSSSPNGGDLVEASDAFDSDIGLKLLSCAVEGRRGGDIVVGDNPLFFSEYLLVVISGDSIFPIDIFDALDAACECCERLEDDVDVMGYSNDLFLADTPDTGLSARDCGGLKESARGGGLAPTVVQETSIRLLLGDRDLDFSLDSSTTGDLSMLTDLFLSLGTSFNLNPPEPASAAKFLLSREPNSASRERRLSFATCTSVLYIEESALLTDFSTSCSESWDFRGMSFLSIPICNS
jgi:hypothetical protein